MTNFQFPILNSAAIRVVWLFWFQLAALRLPASAWKDRFAFQAPSGKIKGGRTKSGVFMNPFAGKASLPRTVPEKTACRADRGIHPPPRRRFRLGRISGPAPARARWTLEPDML